MRKALWLVLALLPANAFAEDMVIYRCTFSSSDVPTLQRTPCPEGSTQQIQQVPEPSATPAPRVEPPAGQEMELAPSSAPPPAAADTPRGLDQARTIMEAGMVEPAGGGDAILDSAALPLRTDPASRSDTAPRAPLPPIFQCSSEEGSRYLHEYEAAPPHCVLLDVQGLGGVTPANAASCEVVRDRCEEVPEIQRCGIWQQRLRDARGRERFAAPENLDAARSERERLQAVLKASDCPVPG